MKKKNCTRCRIQGRNFRKSLGEACNVENVRVYVVPVFQYRRKSGLGGGGIASRKRPKCCSWSGRTYAATWLLRHVETVKHLFREDVRKSYPLKPIFFQIIFVRLFISQTCWTSGKLKTQLCIVPFTPPLPSTPFLHSLLQLQRDAMADDQVRFLGHFFVLKFATKGSYVF